MRVTIDRGNRRRGSPGVTLVELLFAVAITSLLMMSLLSFWAFGSRSFLAMANYQDLDAKSRHALDTMSLEVRQADKVLGFESTGPNKWLLVTNSGSGVSYLYSWNSGTRRLTGQKSGESPRAYLTECDQWLFELYQRTPQRNTTNLFFPATNHHGIYDLETVKLIDMSWKCSRTILGQAVNTESVQTAQIVLRNKE